MSFDYPDAVKAQAVLQSFVSKFLSMDSEDVENQASLSVRVSSGPGQQASEPDLGHRRAIDRVEGAKRRGLGKQRRVRL